MHCLEGAARGRSWAERRVMLIQARAGKRVPGRSCSCERATALGERAGAGERAGVWASVQCHHRAGSTR